MDTFRSIMVTIHIIVGFAALFCFWIPLFTVKGSKIHVKAGIIYFWLTLVVAVSAFLLSIAIIFGLLNDPQAGGNSELIFAMFLTYLSILACSNLLQGRFSVMRVNKHKLLQTKTYKVINYLAIVFGLLVLVIGIQQVNFVLIFLASIGPIVSVSSLILANKKQSRKVYLAQHIGSMIGSGIAVNTAFFVTGFPRMLNITIPTYSIPFWLTPSLVGALIMTYFMIKNFRT